MNPPILRNSVFCQKAPNNSELNNLIQAQDPANDPDIFFDPATGKSVRKGEQPNTFPFDSGNNVSSGNGTNNGSPRCVNPTEHLQHNIEPKQQISQFWRYRR